MAMHIHVQGNLAKDPEFHPYGDNNTGVRARLVIASERERGKHDTPDYFDVRDPALLPHPSCRCRERRQAI